MIDVIYWDSFADEYCLLDDAEYAIAPPERYLPTFRGGNSYIESWDVSGAVDGGKMNIAYSLEDYSDRKIVRCIREAMEREHKCKLRHLRYWVVPEQKFKEYVDMFGLKEADNGKEN